MALCWGRGWEWALIAAAIGGDAGLAFARIANTLWFAGTDAGGHAVEWFALDLAGDTVCFAGKLLDALRNG